jgi:glycosyltransferase involved in cell wall biosynthesis
MRIAIVLTPPLDPTTGGVQMSTVKMVRMLSAHGHEVAVFSFAAHGHMDGPPAPLAFAAEPGGASNSKNIDLFRTWLTSFGPAVIVNQMPYERAITAAIEHHREAWGVACLRNSLYSVRNNLDRFADAVLPSRVARLAKNPVGRAALLHVHRRRHKRDLRMILRSYDRFVLFAEPNLEELRFFVPDYDPKKIEFIPNSIPYVAPEAPQKERRLLWLARVEVHQKRADLILPLWRRLAPLLSDWSFDVVGDGPWLDELRRQATAERLPRIQFHGRQPSQPFFERAPIFIMTSDFEGFPNTLIEAQSQGAVPVALDTYPMVRWLIRNSESGLLVARNDLDALASVVASLAEDPDRLSAMGEHARQAAARFTEERVAAQWNSLMFGLAHPQSRHTEAAR